MGVKDFNYKDISFKSLNINEIIIMPTAQANAGTIFRQS